MFYLIPNKAINILRYKLKRDGKKSKQKKSGLEISIWPDSSQSNQLRSAVSEQEA